jgi:hypothetical protein
MFHGKPVFLDIKELHGMGDDFGGILEMAQIDLSLDALHSDGVERDAHGKSIT